MRISSGVRSVAALACLAGAAGGCQAREAGMVQDTAVVADTGVMGGLTPEEIRARAQPMSPARAESLGIVDTTIHVETQEPNDTLTPRTTPVP